MRICDYSLKSLKMFFQLFQDFKNFIRDEEELVGTKKIQDAWQSLSEEDFSEYKKYFGKIRKTLDDIEKYMIRCRNAPPIK
jgi:hypothetical protein